jgi:hypothetical protein
MNTQTPSIIFSVWNAECSESANRDNVLWIKRQLTKRSIGYLVGEGCYKGKHEPALIVHDIGDTLSFVQRFARVFKQESILRIDANNQARLEKPDGTLIAGLGNFRAVPEQVARKRDAWTRLGDKFFIGTAPYSIPKFPAFKGVSIHG